jgi:hypothetical protein
VDGSCHSKEGFQVSKGDRKSGDIILPTCLSLSMQT